MTGSAMSLPSWVLFHCSVKRTEFVAETNPTVVLGSRVSMDGAAAESPWGTIRPQKTMNHNAGRKLGTTELLLRENSAIFMGRPWEAVSNCPVA